jgi:hypothetical protein
MARPGAAFSSSRVVRVLALLTLTTAAALTAPLASFRAQFDRVDAEGHLLLKLNKTSLPVDLYGVTLKIGADGMLGLMLPSNILVDVKVMVKGETQKGTVPKVILMRGKTSVADELVRQGYATRP